MAANIDAIVESLETTTDILSTLLELKAALSSISTNNLEGFVAVQSVRRIFGLFNTENNEVIEECCSILKVVLQAWSPVKTLELFQSDFELGLQHQSTNIQCLCLRQLELVGESGEMNWESATEAIKTVIHMISNPSLQVAKLAQKVIFNICTSSNSIDLIYSDQFRNTIDEVLQKDDTVKFRFYELLVNISKTSESALQKTHQTGLLQQLLNEVHKDDILAQLNCLELLSDLGLVEHGIVFLDQAGIIKQLETKMGESVSDPLGGLLLPGLIKFFGGVAHFYPKEVLSENKTFVDLILSNLDSNDRSLCSISVQTIGFIGQSSEGKLALDKLGNRFIDGLHTIGKLIKQAPTELREITIQSTATLISVPVAEQTSELCQLTENWFCHLDPNLLQIIMSIAKQPFPELRLSAHKVLSALAELPWGQKKLCEFPGFNEYLLDRSTEKSKEGKESKFEVVRTLTESPTTQDIFGQPYFVQLKAYFLQGAYYVQTESQVAFEGD